MKIGVLGGSFNPPHLGHLHLAKCVYRELELDSVWLMVAGTPPHKALIGNATAQDRLAMCRLLANPYPWLEVREDEIRNDCISYSYHTIRSLKATYPEHTFYWIVGGDMLKSFSSWYRYKDILQELTLIALARENDEDSELAICVESLRQYGKILLLNVESFPLSSTKIRGLIEKNEKYSCYLPENIVQYIERTNLYREVSDMYHVKEKTIFLKHRLSTKRFTHSCNVSRAAKLFAQLYSIDQEKAYFAGLLHDICKEIPYGEQRKLMLAGSFAPDAAEMHSKKLWHGIAGAYFLQTEFGVLDEDILNAVRFHTVARAGMSSLEEIVYMADLISEERDFKGVEKMRRLAFENLQLAMLEAIRDTIRSVMKKGGMIPQYTIDAYNYYLLGMEKSEALEEQK